MFESVSTRKKSGLILAGILAATSISAVYHPQVVHGTNDCTAEFTTMEAEFSSLSAINSSLVTLSGSIHPLISSMGTTTQNTIDTISAFNIAFSGSTLTLTGATLSSFASMASSAFSTADVNYAAVETMSGDLLGLMSSRDTLMSTVDNTDLIQAVEDYETCIAE